jgi:hypothetical protein
MKSEVELPEAADGVFATEVGRVMGRVRSTLAGMFSEFPNGVRKSRDVQKYLGVDANLSWQVFKLLATPDAVGSSRFVPAAVSMRRVFEAARERGVEVEQVEAAELAIRDFERLIRNHAGDRASFESMLAGVVGTSDGDSMRQADLQNRKAVFKGHTYFWGMWVETRLVSTMFAPSRTHPGLYDYGHLRSLLSLRRLRAEANMLVDRYNIKKFNEQQPGTGDRAVAPQRLPLDPLSMERCGAPLIAKFSTAPMPSFTTTFDKLGESRTTLISERVGQKSLVDLTFGNITRGAPVGYGFEGKHRTKGCYVKTWLPTKLLCVNILVHRDSFPRDRLRLSLNVRGHALQTDPNDLADHHGLLPFSERLTYVGRGATGGHTLDVPQHVNMLQYMVDVAGYDLEEFDVYRARIEYPLLDTTTQALVEILD